VQFLGSAEQVEGTEGTPGSRRRWELEALADLSANGLRGPALPTREAGQQ